MAALEAREAALQQQASLLEAARGELGVSRSRLSLIETELSEMRRAQKQQAAQLESARYDLAASRYSQEWSIGSSLA